MWPLFFNFSTFFFFFFFFFPFFFSTILTITPFAPVYPRSDLRRFEQRFKQSLGNLRAQRNDLFKRELTLTLHNVIRTGSVVLLAAVIAIVVLLLFVVVDVETEGGRQANQQT